MSQISITDDSILKVHTARDGRVWFLDGDRLPENSGLSVAEFVGSGAANHALRARVIGSIENAELILQLYERKIREELPSLEVGSPLACSSLARRDKPERVLFDMRKWVVPPSCGGWHEFAATDYPSYYLAVHVIRPGDPSHLLRFVKDHPVWYSMAGIPHLDSSNLGRLIGQILDPRFFVDIDEPDRLSKLESFLGIEPKIAVVEGKSPDATARHERYRTVLKCWKNDDPGPAVAATYPELFVWRTYHETGGGWKGDMKASQRFVQYLRHTWLDALYPDKPWGEPLFASDHFFDREGSTWYQSQLKRKR